MHCVHDLTCSGGGSRADGDVLVAHDRRQKAGKAVLAVLQNQDHLQSYELSWKEEYVGCVNSTAVCGERDH